MKITGVLMFLIFYKTYLPGFLGIVFFFCVVMSPAETSAQGFYKVTDRIGGSGSSTGQTGDTGNNNSTLIIVGAAVIAGFLVYKLVLDKDKPVKDTKTDSTSSKQSLLIKDVNKDMNNIVSESEKFQQVPVNFYAGVQKNDLLMPGRKIIVGFIYNF